MSAAFCCDYCNKLFKYDSHTGKGGIRNQVSWETDFSREAYDDFCSKKCEKLYYKMQKTYFENSKGDLVL